MNVCNVSVEGYDISQITLAESMSCAIERNTAESIGQFKVKVKRTSYILWNSDSADGQLGQINHRDKILEVLETATTETAAKRNEALQKVKSERRAPVT